MTGMSASAAVWSTSESVVPSIEAMIRAFGALGDHVLDLRDLGGDVVFRVLQVDGEALALERGLDGVAVLDPALRALGRHRDADQAAVARRRRSRCHRMRRPRMPRA